MKKKKQTNKEGNENKSPTLVVPGDHEVNIDMICLSITKICLISTVFGACFFHLRAYSELISTCKVF